MHTEGATAIHAAQLVEGVERDEHRAEEREHADRQRDLEERELVDVHEVVRLVVVRREGVVVVGEEQRLGAKVEK